MSSEPGRTRHEVPVAADDAVGLPSRREIVREGAKLAFVAPLLSTFLASQAYAANYSCYPAGHACTDLGTDAEPCCNGPCSGTPGVCP